MKYICLHGHFYQPPRENPYTEKISLQESAYPFHDWNARINFECYGPNGFSRVLDEKNLIVKIINNYEHISYNFGPTLLSWLKINALTTYKAILEADKKSVEKFDGHGSALAQVYNHVILPLSNRQDKEVQVKWGIRDFEYHFNRKPEGMWLAETAVDTETLEVLAENNIRFTILSPFQAKEIKEQYEQEFKPVHKEILDTNKPYKVKLPSGKEIVIFFYQGDIAHQLSFGKLLNNGEVFFNHLKKHFDFNSEKMEILNVALDGETFGHHHKLGDMALAYCINMIENSPDVQLINYGKFLELYVPTTEVHIHEKTAWSCAHGVGRWSYNCGCRGDGDPSWTQDWRKPLRDALNFLNYEAHEVFKEISSNYFNNPEVVLFDYVNVILERSKDKALSFFKKHSNKKISESDLIILSRVFELKRNCQLMFTSCGWFFTEVSGIETVQILMFADRVLQIYNALINNDITDKFLAFLKLAKSNIPNIKDAEWIYKNYVRPNRQDLSHIGMIQAFNYINNDLFNELEAQNTKINIQSIDKIEMGYTKVLVGDFELQSKVTYSKKYFYFVLLQMSRANFIGYYTMTDKISFNPAKKSNLVNEERLNNIPYLLEDAKKMFKNSFSLNSLFKEDLSLILKSIAQKEQININKALEDIYLRNYPLCVQFKTYNLELPRHLFSNIKTVLKDKLIESLKEEICDTKNLDKIIKDILRWEINLNSDLEEISLNCSYTFRKLFLYFENNINKELAINTIFDFINIIQPLQLNLNLWNSQNIFFNILSSNKLHFLEMKSHKIEVFNKLKFISTNLKIDMEYVIQD